MSDKDRYRTIDKRSQGVYKDRGSKFIALAIPVDTESQVKAELEALKKQYHDARHHCYAWRLGWDYSRHRINDDGEPSGSAGNPIFGQLRSHNLTNILVVVVRYFGGTKLGIRGLINAYRDASKEALNNNTITTKTIRQRISLHFQYAQMGAVMQTIKENQLHLLNTIFETDCRLELAVTKSKTEEIIKKFKSIDGVIASTGGPPL